ncbi:hypothetical protein Aoki45_14150 [Algoriphagus sp. oki45]|nr:hypothetical protein Aoki45_14150 [Algoriphagus sp. oki45]
MQPKILLKDHRSGMAVGEKIFEELQILLKNKVELQIPPSLNYGSLLDEV